MFHDYDLKINFLTPVFMGFRPSIKVRQICFDLNNHKKLARQRFFFPTFKLNTLGKVASGLAKKLF
jgi:hypothetical protein